MKKTLAIMLALLLAFSFVACSQPDNAPPATDSEEPTDPVEPTPDPVTYSAPTWALGTYMGTLGMAGETTLTIGESGFSASSTMINSIFKPNGMSSNSEGTVITFNNANEVSESGEAWKLNMSVKLSEESETLTEVEVLISKSADAENTLTVSINVYLDPNGNPIPLSGTFTKTGSEVDPTPDPVKYSAPTWALGTYTGTLGIAGQTTLTIGESSFSASSTVINMIFKPNGMSSDSEGTVITANNADNVSESGEAWKLNMSVKLSEESETLTEVEVLISKSADADNTISTSINVYLNPNSNPLTLTGTFTKTDTVTE